MTTMAETNTEAGVGTLLNKPPKKSAFAFGSCIDNSSTAWAMSATTLLLAELKADMKAIRAELTPQILARPPPPPSPVSLALPPLPVTGARACLAGPSPRFDLPPPKAFYTPQKRPHMLKPIDGTSTSMNEFKELLEKTLPKGGKWRAPMPMGMPTYATTSAVANANGVDAIQEQSRQARIAMKSKAIHEMLMKARQQEVRLQLTSKAAGPREALAPHELAAAAA